MGIEEISGGNGGGGGGGATRIDVIIVLSKKELPPCWNGWMYWKESNGRWAAGLRIGLSLEMCDPRKDPCNQGTGKTHTLPSTIKINLLEHPGNWLQGKMLFWNPGPFRHPLFHRHTSAEGF